MENQLNQLLEFLQQKDENGLSNMTKIETNQKILRRVDTTDKDQSVEVVKDDEVFNGIVMDDDKIIGFGIHIYNEDVYPLKSFEIYLRNCGLSGELDLSNCADMVFLDLYHNDIVKIKTANMPSMRIFGVQDNDLESLDVSQMPVCQGIDVGNNHLKDIDVSANSELVELYVNDNDISYIDLSNNLKLKYFYCHNNHIKKLDVRKNHLLRHLNATGNPLKNIFARAPQRDEELPLELSASEGGCVGLKFNPVYNAQWKETGEWQQSYFAYADEGYCFDGWYENDKKISSQEVWIDDYGSSHILRAVFSKKGS